MRCASGDRTTNCISANDNADVSVRSETSVGASLLFELCVLIVADRSEDREATGVAQWKIG